MLRIFRSLAVGNTKQARCNNTFDAEHVREIGVRGEAGAFFQGETDLSQNAEAAGPHSVTVSHFTLTQTGEEIPAANWVGDFLNVDLPTNTHTLISTGIP